MTKKLKRSIEAPIQTMPAATSADGMTDGQLLEHFLRLGHDEAGAAFAHLVRIHGPMVWNVCRGVLPDLHAAEDAFQATFLILARRAGSIRRRDRLGPWLYGVARRVAVRAKSIEGRHRPREGHTPDPMADPAPDPSRQEQIDALHEEVGRLAEKYRNLVVLCYFDGRTHAEAASLIKCPIGTVSVRLSRARDILRDRLTRRGLAVPAVWTGLMLGSETSSAAISTGLVESTIKAAINLAAGKVMTAGAVPASVAHLIHKEILAMGISKLTAIAVGLATGGLATAGIALLAAGGRASSVGDGAAAPARVERSVTSPVVQAAAPLVRGDGDDRQQRAESSGNLKKLGVAMLSQAYDRNPARFPADAIRKGGKPLLSWRVALLPQLGEQALYAKFHLDEPWDSTHNKALLNQMPAIYSPVSRQVGETKYSTYYQVFVGPGALFADENGSRLDAIKDNRSLTIVAVEAAKPVPWTKPEDITFGGEKPLPDLVGGQFDTGFFALFADGRVRFIGKENKPEVLRALITANGGEDINVGELR